MKNAILKGLNEQQHEAVTHGAGPLLVLAGAGSGKTRVLTHRVAHLIASGVPAYNFCAVTFTNKAAGEMRARIKRLVYRDVWVSTFHSSCLRILKQESRFTSLGDHFSIYDDSDQLLLIKECLKEKNLDDKQFIPKSIREQINRAKDTLLDPDALREKNGTYYDEVLCDIYELYEKKLLQYKGLDFGGLIQKCIELFLAEPQVLSRYQDRFEYILIDEYQDTNHAQYSWVKLLANKHRNLTVVGDPDQSIYGWRGADIENILRFEHDYPDAAIIKLDKNYRSTQTILDASNALISHNLSRKEKDLWTDHEKGDLLVLYHAVDEKDETEFLITQIAQLKRDGISINDMVVFYRVHAQSRILEDGLRKYNIPYKIIGGVRFYDRREIKDMLAYLRVIAQPHDDVSLLRIINVPTRGIGQKALNALSSFKAQQGISLYEAMGKIDQIKAVSTRAKTSITRFRALIDLLRKKKQALPPSRLLSELLAQTEYLDILSKDNTFEARARVENIKEFMGVITEFEENQQGGSEGALLEAFLDTISLESSIDSFDQDDSALTLMTIHCAKGLEFDVVFMVGMEEELFPHSNVLSSSNRELEEERRLCYVAITRARKKVFCSCAESRRLYGSRMYNRPSRFLKEIPPHHITIIRQHVDLDMFDLEEEDEDVLDYDLL
jgi:DNA helicase II / ATP-dependent DNA helicase PcrA